LQKKIRILSSYSRVSDGGRSSTVEPQIVVLVVAGSSPVGHPESKFGARDPTSSDFEAWSSVRAQRLYLSPPRLQTERLLVDDTGVALVLLDDAARVQHRTTAPFKKNYNSVIFLVATNITDL
jgi:hypothetical protein